MPAEILSLDLDWFNTVDRSNLKFEITHFFATLKQKCKLPSTIEFVPEHQYFYPWSLKLLSQRRRRKMNVINIDEHHDFYCLQKIDFDSKLEEVGCWNFFAFMAHKQLIDKYTWVHNSEYSPVNMKADIMEELTEAQSPIVRKFKRNIRINKASSVFRAVKGLQFDGFMIIRSPEYTENYRAVYNAVEEALAEELPRTRVRKYKCRTNFSSGRVHHRANSLFWKV